MGCEARVTGCLGARGAMTVRDWRMSHDLVGLRLTTKGPANRYEPFFVPNRWLARVSLPADEQEETMIRDAIQRKGPVGSEA